jgi:hypothetical protein
MNQVFPLESAAEAFDLMMGGKARFRAALQQEISYHRRIT